MATDGVLAIVEFKNIFKKVFSDFSYEDVIIDFKLKFRF